MSVCVCYISEALNNSRSENTLHYIIRLLLITCIHSFCKLKEPPPTPKCYASRLKERSFLFCYIVCAQFFKSFEDTDVNIWNKYSFIIRRQK